MEESSDNHSSDEDFIHNEDDDSNGCSSNENQHSQLKLRSARNCRRTGPGFSDSDSEPTMGLTATAVEGRQESHSHAASSVRVTTITLHWSNASGSAMRTRLSPSRRRCTDNSDEFLDNDGVAAMEDAGTHIPYRALLKDIQSAADECAARYENRSDGESSCKTNDKSSSQGIDAVAMSGHVNESTEPDDVDEGSALQPSWTTSSDDEVVPPKFTRRRSLAIQDSDDDER
jgi:hypothetical protein